MLCCNVVKVEFEKNCGPDSECISSLKVVAKPELPRSIHTSHCIVLMH